MTSIWHVGICFMPYDALRGSRYGRRHVGFGPGSRWARTPRGCCSKSMDRCANTYEAGIGTRSFFLIPDPAHMWLRADL